MTETDGNEGSDAFSSMRSQLELAGFNVDRIEHDADSRSIALRYVLTAEATASVTDAAVASRVLDEHVPKLAQAFASVVNNADEPDRYRRLLVLALDPPEVSASDERRALRLEIETTVAHEFARHDGVEQLAPLYRDVADTAVLADPDGEPEADLDIRLDIE